VEGSDADFLASDSNVLGCQHGCVWRGFITIGLDFHATSNTADSFTTTVNIQVSYLFPNDDPYVSKVLPEIGNVNEGIVEGSENSGNAKDEFTCVLLSVAVDLRIPSKSAHPLEFEVPERCSPPCARLSSSLAAY
jgi:hypothetical protein